LTAVQNNYSTNEDDRDFVKLLKVYAN